MAELLLEPEDDGGDVEVGGQIVTGSSVSHVKVSYQPQLLPEISSTEKNVQGEAVDVRLPNGRHVFALLASTDNPDYATSIAGKLFADVPHDNRSSGAWTGLYSVISRLRETRDLPPNLYPMFVTFDDITDPRTVLREVDPANRRPHWGGPGHRAQTRVAGHNG